jgi:hypothetical protein
MLNSDGFGGCRIVGGSGGSSALNLAIQRRQFRFRLLTRHTRVQPPHDAGVERQCLALEHAPFAHVAQRQPQFRNDPA